MADVSIQLGYKDSNWFTSNPTFILKEGQIVFLEQTGTYKIGDGITVLQNLGFKGLNNTCFEHSFVFNGLTEIINASVHGLSKVLSVNTYILNSGIKEQVNFGIEINDATQSITITKKSTSILNTIIEIIGKI